MRTVLLGLGTILLGGCSSGGASFGLPDAGTDDAEVPSGSVPGGPVSSSSTDSTRNPQCQGLRFFVTRTVYAGDLGGLSGADDKCRQAADAEGLGGTWRAWLSNTESPIAKDRISGDGPWCTVDGLIVFKNAANLHT